MSTVIDKPLTQVELQKAIFEFAQGRDTGYLGTCGSGGVHVSPVKFFIDRELNIYIHSRGGTKFDNLAVDDQVCLLVSTPFADDFHEIKGVRLFGKAKVAEPNSQLYEMAEELCPWEHSEDVRLIHVQVTGAVYVDRLHGRDIKQRWSRS